MAEFARRWQNGTIEDLNKCMLALLGTMITPGLINLGGGTPAKEALPLKEIRDIADDVFTIDKRGVEASLMVQLQGLKILRKLLSNIFWRLRASRTQQKISL